MVQYRHYRVILVARFDRAGEEGYLATWRAIPAKVCYNMVSSTLKIDVILPNPAEQENHRPPISIRILHDCWDGPYGLVDIHDGNVCVDLGRFFGTRYPAISHLRPGIC